MTPTKKQARAARRAQARYKSRLDQAKATRDQYLAEGWDSVFADAERSAAQAHQVRLRSYRYAYPWSVLRSEDWQRLHIKMKGGTP